MIGLATVRSRAPLTDLRSLCRRLTGAAEVNADGPLARITSSHGTCDIVAGRSLLVVAARSPSEEQLGLLEHLVTQQLVGAGCASSDGVDWQPRVEVPFTQLGREGRSGASAAREGRARVQGSAG